MRGKGRFIVTEYVATEEKSGPRFPLLLTTGRILSQYNVGAQTRRTAQLGIMMLAERAKHHADFRDLLGGRIRRSVSVQSPFQICVGCNRQRLPEAIYRSLNQKLSLVHVAASVTLGSKQSFAVDCTNDR